MEDPSGWGPAEDVVADVLEEHDEMVCGLSLPRKIVNALRAAELLKE